MSDQPPNDPPNEPPNDPDFYTEPGGQFSQRIRHEQISARVPEEVSRGVFATGALVFNGPHEFIIDFLQSMSRPHQVVGRIVLPPTIMGSMVRALRQNFDNYEKRFGPMPEMPQPGTGRPGAGPSAGQTSPHPPTETGTADPPAPPAAPQTGGEQTGAASPGGGNDPANAAPPPPPSVSETGGGAAPGPGLTPADSPKGPNGGGADQSFGEAGMTSSTPTDSTGGSAGAGQSKGPPPSVEEIYNQLKLPDDIIPGSYANTVMISHSPSEFCFDFIANFYPRSVVTARIFMSVAQVPRVYSTLERSYEKFRQKVEAQQRRRRNPPPGKPPEGDQGLDRS